MDFIKKHRLKIILAIGVIFILMGLVQPIFHIEFNRDVADKVSFVLMIIAVILFVGNRKTKGDTNKQMTQDQIEVANADNQDADEDNNTNEDNETNESVEDDK